MSNKEMVSVPRADIELLVGCQQGTYVAPEGESCIATGLKVFKASARLERALAQPTDQNRPVLLWKAPMEPKPEPVALLSYGGKNFAIPYTLMDWISGWVLLGQVGTAVAAIDAIDNTRAALDGIVAMMARDANPLSPEEVTFYKSHHLYQELEWPYIKDFSDSPADEAMGERFRVDQAAPIVEVIHQFKATNGEWVEIDRESFDTWAATDEAAGRCQRRRLLEAAQARGANPSMGASGVDGIVTDKGNGDV